MVARQTTRFIGYIICIPMAILILVQYRHLVGPQFFELFSNIPRAINVLLHFLFIIGIALSFNFPILGGLVIFLSPFTLMVIDWISRSSITMPGPDVVIMLTGSAFILLTTQRSKD